MSALRAYLELARVSNLPTCFTNVLVGVAVGRLAISTEVDNALIIGLCVGVALLYVGGMALNDVVDAPFDREHNPHRPIPSGRMCRRRALVYSLLALVLGVVLIGVTAIWKGAGASALAWAAGLAATIVVYDLVHKRLAAAVILMGVCRGLVYLTCAAAVGAEFDRTVAFTIAGAMAAYIVVVTALARGEHRKRPTLRPIVALVLPALVLGPGSAVVARPAGIVWPAIATGILVVLWLTRCSHVLVRDPSRVRDAVMGWLAGICLADAFFLALLDRPKLAAVAVILFVVTTLAHRRILGT